MLLSMHSENIIMFRIFTRTRWIFITFLYLVNKGFGKFQITKYELNDYHLDDIPNELPPYHKFDSIKPSFNPTIYNSSDYLSNKSNDNNIDILNYLSIYEIIIIGSGLIFFCIIIYLIYISYNRIYGRANAFNYRKLRRYTSCFYRPKHHPKYSPMIDTIKNRYLPIDQCNICSDKYPSFVLSCNHKICIEDMKGYINSALNNITMFPLKCPLYVEGCSGMIDAFIAKRVLNRVLYKKFLELSDRVSLGEGMRCLSCFTYISFIIPNKLDNNNEDKFLGNIIGHMAICSYCYDKYCIRCKSKWHFKNTVCPYDQVDESLEKWKDSSKAQKCPNCLKIIEKEDDSTCHHMVHKITDSIPCIRDRTDFCYLCGTEVTPNYPHEELLNMGINHFPNGVFQNCRIIINKEKEKNRAKLKRLKRLNMYSPVRRNNQVAPFNDVNYDDTSFSPMSDIENIIGHDDIDQQWRNVQNRFYN